MNDMRTGWPPPWWELAGCAGNPEPVKVPQKKAESDVF